MIFFTDITTDASNFCLLHIDKYDDPRKAQKRMVFVDPGVHYLEKHDDFPHLEQLHQLASGGLLANEYISIDYPGDMFPEKHDLFIKRTYENCVKYKDNPQYIQTVQFHLHKVEKKKHGKNWRIVATLVREDVKSFIEGFDKVFPFVAGKRRILGIGNMCKIMKSNRYLKEIFAYIQRHSKEIWWIHFYGLALDPIKQLIPMLYNMKVSVDSTKWTRPSNDKFKRKHMIAKGQTQLFPTTHCQRGLCPTKETRGEFFREYMKDIRRAGINVQW